MDLMQMLKRNEALARMSQETLDALARASSVQKLRRGESVWHAGEHAEWLVVCAQGLVKVLAPSTGGTEIVLALCGPGELVGVSELLEHSQYPAAAVALTDSVTFVRIPRDHVMRALEREAGASIEIARIVGRTAGLAHRRMSLFTASAEERLASTMIDLSERFGDEMEDGTTLIPLKLTRAELAAMIGTTVETTIRTLSRWTREGLVTTIDGGFTVHDPAMLARRAAAPSPFVTAALSSIRPAAAVS